MKRVNMFLAAAFFATSICMTVVVTSCDKEEYIESGIVTLTTNSDEFTVVLWGSGTANIDWGDGTESESVAIMRHDPISISRTYSEISIRTITVSGKIAGFSCQNQLLINLDVSKHKGLIRLVCVNNQLINLDVSGATKLIYLFCRNNQLSKFDVSKNTRLGSSSCEGNQLKSLDVSKNTKLESFSCDNNQLTSLDVSRNTELRFLHCKNNLLSANALNVLFGTLPKRDDLNAGYIYIIGNPGTGSCNRDIATTKKWTVYYH